MDVALRCFHCGDALPPQAPRVEIDGAYVPMCCEGCGAAARWIRDAGLGDYYRLRSSEGPRVAQADDDYAAWLHPDVLGEHARRVPGGMEITVLTSAMRCAACAWLIDRALTPMEGVREISANAVTGRIRIGWDPARIALPLILRQLAALGFAPHLATGASREDARRRTRRQDLMRLGVAGLGAMQAMMFTEALYLDFDAQMPLATRDFLRWVAFLVSLPVVFYSGWPFLRGMLREWREWRLGMDALVGTSILLAFGASLIETIRGGPHVWYDAAVMFVLLLLAARQLEAWARSRASAQVDALARARPALAWRENGEGGRIQVPLAALRVDDVVQVAAGEALPADGVLLDAGASVDESLLTGEAAAVAKASGERVLAGSVCRETPLRMRVSAAGQDTRLSHLVRLVERAQGQRPQLARIADRIASAFVLTMFALASIVFALWWQIDSDRAFQVTLALLVVSCPCALSLAIPAALATAHGRLARLGVLSLRPDALETLARVDALLLDKTGTLTTGRPVLREVETFGASSSDDVLRIAAALQRDSGHPLARAFAASGPVPAAVAVQVQPGLGVQGPRRGHRLSPRSRRFRRAARRRRRDLAR